MGRTIWSGWPRKFVTENSAFFKWQHFQAVRAEPEITQPRAVSHCPVPLSTIACGEPTALSVIVTAAVAAPAAAGAKCPWIVQLAPTAKLVGQLFAKTNEDAFVPVTAILPIVNAAVPVLVIVTVSDPLSEPTLTVPNDKLVAESVTGAAGAVPVPLNRIV